MTYFAQLYVGQHASPKHRLQETLCVFTLPPALPPSLEKPAGKEKGWSMQSCPGGLIDLQKEAELPQMLQPETENHFYPQAKPSVDQLDPSLFANL